MPQSDAQGNAAPAPFKEGINESVVRYYADGLAERISGFRSDGFLTDVMDHLEALELKARVKHIAAQVHTHLGGNYLRGLDAFADMLRAEEANEAPSFAFLHWPMAQFVEDYGLDHIEPSVDAMREITQHFSCEFAVRPFLVRYPKRMLEVMYEWASDENVHVRRNASEGLRPRLPWGLRLQSFVDDPTPVFGVLDMLRKDPEEYVRRSVSNCLNDIAKDHPGQLMHVLAEWDADPGQHGEWIKKRALRTLVKAGDPQALELLGFGRPKVRVEGLSVDAPRYAVGDTVEISFSLVNAGNKKQRLVVDYRVHYVKANGSTSPKVFKLKTIELEPSERHDVVRRQHLRPISTRRYYPGTHAVDVQVNGETFGSAEFEVSV